MVSVSCNLYRVRGTGCGGTGYGVRVRGVLGVEVLDTGCGYVGDWVWGYWVRGYWVRGYWVLISPLIDSGTKATNLVILCM